MRPRPLPSNSRNSCLPSSAVNSLQNTALSHLTSFLSAFSALFSATGARQPFGNQSVPHSFYRHGGVGGSIPLSSRTVLLPPRIASPAAALTPLQSHSYKHAASKPFMGKFLRKTRWWGVGPDVENLPGRFAHSLLPCFFAGLHYNPGASFRRHADCLRSLPRLVGAVTLENDGASNISCNRRTAQCRQVLALQSPHRNAALDRHQRARHHARPHLRHSRMARPLPRSRGHRRDSPR